MTDNSNLKLLKGLRAAAPFMADLVPYDPRYLPARSYLNANENPYGLSREVAAKIAARFVEEESGPLGLNRYPAPLADVLRSRLAQRTTLLPEQILIGNGGDELIADLIFAWGGEGRSLLIAPPGFSSYELSAGLNATGIRRIWRKADFQLDEAAILEAAKEGADDLIMLASPNNPTGDCLSAGFVEELLAATDALVMIDQAYIEFAAAEFDLIPLLDSHPNLVILRTFSKAWGLAGLRIGYLLGHPQVISELVKIRQPYSVDSFSMLAAECVLDEDAAYASQVAEIIAERQRLTSILASIPELEVFPSEANFFLLRMERAVELWEYLYRELGILTRDFSGSQGLRACLRISVGQPAENDAFVAALREFLNRY
ncbi:MAG: histidinol-phosphate transaminase [Coriobacteriales bacterium]|jgi:histidinol-phosphate aminotransferase|nr:histidinol-phosphate transaminase [Coriobacteriales bacterium]